MKVEDLFKQANRIIDSVGERSPAGVLAEATEFLRVHAGERSAFYIHISDINRGADYRHLQSHVESILSGFIRYVENGLLEGTSIERQAQIDVVSDFLGQAQFLLESKEVHPTAPTVIIGASLEEFLRNWVEEVNLEIGDNKPGIDTYAQLLRKAGMIEKQDFKDITAWAGLRNDAAHGEWDNVSNREKISNMLHGVNLFMRKYAGRSE